MNVKVAILIFCLLLTPILVSAIEIPTLNAYTTDQVGALTISQLNDLNQALQFIEENTTVEIAVLITDTTGDESIDSYALKVFEKNGIGKADVDNGLLLVIATTDRTYRFETGYGLEGTLNAGILGRIGRNVLEPELKEDNYYQGIFDSLDVIYAYLIQDPEVISKEQSKQQNSQIISISFIVLFIILLIFLRIKYNIPLFFFGGGGGSGGGFSGFGGGSSGGGGFSGRY